MKTPAKLGSGQINPYLPNPVARDLSYLALRNFARFAGAYTIRYVSLVIPYWYAENFSVGFHMRTMRTYLVTQGCTAQAEQFGQTTTKGMPKIQKPLLEYTQKGGKIKQEVNGPPLAGRTSL